MKNKYKYISEKNAAKAAKKYGRDSSGHFGHRGKNCREITSGNGLSSSIGFFNIMSRTGEHRPIEGTGKTYKKLSDGTSVVHRRKTRSKSPAVNISGSPSRSVPKQKIHFETVRRKHYKKKNARNKTGIHK